MSSQFRALFFVVTGCLCMAAGSHAMAETTLSSLVQGATDKTTQQLQSTSVSSSSSTTKSSAAATAGGNSASAAAVTTTVSMLTQRPSNATTAATHTLTTADGSAVPVTGSSASSTVSGGSGGVATLDVPTYAPAVADGHVDFGSPSPNKRESDSIQRALDMLREKRSPDYGWENDTHMVILAKELSGARDPTDADGHVQQIQELEDLLSVKQMEIEILSMLDKHHVLPRPVNPDKLARYVLALGSLCKDPKRFYGHDLVAALQHHEPTQVFNPNNPNNSNINNNHPNNQPNTTTTTTNNYNNYNKPAQPSHDSAAGAAAAGGSSSAQSGGNSNNQQQVQPPSSYQQHPPPPLHQQQSNDRKLLSSQLLAVSELQDQEFALTTLAVCSSAAHVRKRQIRRLLDIASGVTDQSVDTIAMVILALRCIVTDHRHRHLQHFVRRPARGLATLQDMRGNFGSLRSTALAMQALQDLEPDPAGAWNRSAASDWILERQRSDGGWYEEPIHDGQEPNVGIGLTADIILALGWKGLGAVRALQCDHVIGETSDNASENGEPKLAAPVGLASSAEESEPRNISYTYTLWLGTNVTEAFSLSLISPKNTSFFRAMTQAADIDPRFGFEAREWPNGHYVHTLAGKKEEPRGYNYWLLYRLPELPDPNSPPGNQLIAPVGVDELMVEENEHYLYWYKKL